MVDKTRVVIIAHPDFQGGAEGIKEAKDFALNLINGQKHMIDAAEKSGEPAAKIRQVRNHTQQYQIVIRNIEKDVI